MSETLPHVSSNKQHVNGSIHYVNMCCYQATATAHGCVEHDTSRLSVSETCAAVTVDVNVFQDYGLDLNAFRELVPDCPQRLLELAASCCMVRRGKSRHIEIQY